MPKPMSEQLIVIIGQLVSFACLFFFFINFFMFMTAWRDNWEWRSIIAIIIVDVLYIALVCIGIWVISHL